jgi:hypothetical protein
MAGSATGRVAPARGRSGRRRHVPRLVLAAAVAVAVALCPLVGAVPATAAPAAPLPSPSAPAGSAPSGTTCPDRPALRPDHAPVLAHFYIWFNASSWNRAKTDYPAVGRYSSDQTSVMRRQVAQARAAGIDGFIVSWKSTELLNSRLAALRGVAAETGFKLALTYQAQDFNRKPLPAEQVRSDLEEFAASHADDPVFQVLGPRPVVALSGTWNYSEEELRSITAPVASRLLVLATEKNVAGYERVAPAVGGELYYWSSVDPERNEHYEEKLRAMANAARDHCGVWIAPVSPGFDARLIGGRSVVDRRNGETLRRSWQGALATVPDAIGVISWNEFSENTYIEPSTKYGARYLETLGRLTGAPPIPAKELDSSAPQGVGSPTRGALTGSGALLSVLLVTALGIWRRRRATGR